jgi:hypothetical protein
MEVRQAAFPATVAALQATDHPGAAIALAIVNICGEIRGGAAGAVLDVIET